MSEQDAETLLDEAVHQDWSRDTQKRAVLAWISFLTAAAFSVLLFAFVDPYLLLEALGIYESNNIYTGYAIGFFFLWCNGLVSGWLILRLVRRKRTGPINLPRTPDR